MAKINVNNIDWEQEENDEQFRGGCVKNKKNNKHRHTHDVNDDFYKPRNKKMNKPHRIKKDRDEED